MLIAQITDMHMVEAGRLALGLIDTNGWMARCVERLMSLERRPDCVLITGDLTDHGRSEQYACLRETLAPLDMPLYVLPGNHDRRETLSEAFADQSYLPRDGGFLHYVVEDWPVRLIVLDTVVAGETAGALCAERLDWLDARLAEAPDRPTVIAMHHPPFATGIGFMDRIGLDGGPALAEVVGCYGNIERIVCGHVHRPVQARFAGTVASICPSTAHQIVLTFNDEQDDAWVAEPPAFQLHLWHPQSGLVTHTVPIEDYGPFRSFGS
jgi:3',5'-cyclic AMP phosphodiesterase CpdA